MPASNQWLEERVSSTSPPPSSCRADGKARRRCTRLICWPVNPLNPVDHQIRPRHASRTRRCPPRRERRARLSTRVRLADDRARLSHAKDIKVRRVSLQVFPGLTISPRGLPRRSLSSGSCYHPLLIPRKQHDARVQPIARNIRLNVRKSRSSARAAAPCFLANDVIYAVTYLRAVRD